MGRLFAGCLISAVVLGLASACLAEDAHLTNLQLVERAVRAAVDSMDLRPPGGRTAEVEVEVAGGAGASWLLDSVLKEQLLSSGWNVRAQGEGAGGESEPESGFALKVRIIDVGLKYGRSWRRFALGGKIVERIATASLYYELVERSPERVLSSRVLASSSVRSEIRDTVPASLLSTLSDPEYAFAAPELAKSQWDRYLEGGLVLAIIGVLIYLFYSNKTAS